MKMRTPSVCNFILEPTSDKINNNMNKLKNLLLDIFFPPKCAVCDGVGWFLCPDCKGVIQEVKIQSCPGCNKISKDGRYCPRCCGRSKVKGILAYGYFKNEELKKTLHEFKYNGVFSLAPDLANLLEKKIKDSEIGFDLIAFVPTTKNRESKRGYNQSGLIAIEIGSRFAKPVFKNLKKIRGTKNQVGLTGRERRENLSQAFLVTKNQELLKNKKVLLIDDVCTTGSTLNECGETLLKAGAKSVFGAVIAKE